MSAYQEGRRAFDERDWNEYDVRNPYADRPDCQWLAEQWEKGYDDANEAAYDRRHSDDWSPDECEAHRRHYGY